MPKGYDRKSHRNHGYFQRTLYPVHSLLIIAPLLGFFHLAGLYHDTNLLGPKLVGQLLGYFGATQAFLPALLIVVVLAFQQILRRDPWTIHPPVVAGMIGESILWTIPLIGIGQITGRLSQIAANASMKSTHAGWLGTVLSSVGAGVYEEFLFRMVLISMIVLLLADVAGLKRDTSTAFVVITAAVLFGACHFSGAQLTGSAPMPWHDFIFLAVAGTLWGALYVYRGFAVAVGSHIVWNLYALAMKG